MAIHFRNFEIRPRCVGSEALQLPAVKDHLRNAPRIFHVFWGVSTACCLAVLGMTLPMIIRFLVEGEKLRKMKRFVFLPGHVRLTVQILCLFPLLSILSWTAMIIVRQAVLCELLSYLYNMAVLFWFFELVITYLGGFERALYILQREPPWHVMRVPPLCCFNFCAKQRQFTENDLRMTRFLIFQYAVIGPMIAVADALNESYLNILHYLRVCVTLMCMWGLVTIYRGSCRVLGSFHMGWKYIIIQATVVLTNFTTIVAGLLVEGYDEVYTAEVMAEAWVNFVFNFMMVPLTLIAVFAYPTQDIYLREKFVDELTHRLRSSPTDFDFYLGSHRDTFGFQNEEDLEAAYCPQRDTSAPPKEEKQTSESTTNAEAATAEGKTCDSKTPTDDNPAVGPNASTQVMRAVQSAGPHNTEVENVVPQMRYSKSITHLACLPMPLEHPPSNEMGYQDDNTQMGTSNNGVMLPPAQTERPRFVSKLRNLFEGRRHGIKHSDGGTWGEPRTPPRPGMQPGREPSKVSQTFFTPEERSKATSLAAVSPSHTSSSYSHPEEPTITSPTLRRPKLTTVSDVSRKSGAATNSGANVRPEESAAEQTEPERSSDARTTNGILTSFSSVSPLRRQRKHSD